jgi:Flp pilus assembly protein TadG
MRSSTAIVQRFKPFVECEQGTQIIEFAFLLPFLVLLFASSVEMGRMFYTYTTLQKSAEVGARYLSTKVVSSGNFSSADVNKATNLVVCGSSSTAATGCDGQTPVTANLGAANVTITAPGTALGTRYVRVQVTYSYQPLVFDIGSLTGNQQLSLNFTFTPRITMRYML